MGRRVVQLQLGAHERVEIVAVKVGLGRLVRPVRRAEGGVQEEVLLGVALDEGLSELNELMSGEVAELSIAVAESGICPAWIARVSGLKT